MEPNEKEKKAQDPSSSNSQTPAVERIETPFPAQEIFPLEQAMNDGKKKNNADRLKEENDK